MPSAMAVMMAYNWPGNVRELRNAVVRAVTLFPGRDIGASDVPGLLLARPRLSGAASHAGDTAIDLTGVLRGMERQHLVAALAAAHGVVADAARLVGLKRTTFAERLKRHALGRSSPA